MSLFAAAVIVTIFLLSAGVWVGIGLRWSRGLPALVSAPRCPSPMLPIAAGAAAVLVTLMVIASTTTLLIAPTVTPTVDLSDVRTSAFDGLVHIVVALLLLTGAGRVPLRDCGLDPTGLGRQLQDGVGGFLAAVVPVAMVLAATYVLRTPENQHPFLKLIQEARSIDAVVWLLLTAVVIVPLKEELIFRVMLQEGLTRITGSGPAIGITAILFCFVHGFPDSLALLPLAVILGYVYDRRQSLISVVVTHALFNLANISLLLVEIPE